MEKAQKKPKSTLARNFIKRRKEMGYTQETLAAASGVGQTTIKQIEGSESEGTATTRGPLEQVLKCTWEDLWQRPIKWATLTPHQKTELIADIAAELQKPKK